MDKLRLNGALRGVGHMIAAMPLAEAVSWLAAFAIGWPISHIAGLWRLLPSLGDMWEAVFAGFCGLLACIGLCAAHVLTRRLKWSSNINRWSERAYFAMLLLAILRLSAYTRTPQSGYFSDPRQFGFAIGVCHLFAAIGFAMATLICRERQEEWQLRPKHIAAAIAAITTTIAPACLLYPPLEYWPT